ncbi:MAG: ROK family protein [Planctomycetota bacterium]
MADREAAPLLAGIEAGGTKFVVGVGSRPTDLRLDCQTTEARQQFETERGSDAVLPAIVAWLRQQQERLGRRIDAIGIASFGPVDLDELSGTYGHITTTPKRAWQTVSLVGPFREAFGDGVPIGFDTDVNGAALGEHRWGAARGVEDFVYVTVGTGLGAGAMSRGRLVHGMLHPEMGHLLLPRIEGDEFAGVCDWHGACWEGLCSGPAIHARVDQPADTLPADHDAWRYVTGYMGRALANIVCTLSPRRIVIGGSVRKAGGLGEAEFFRRVRAELQAALNNYLDAKPLRTGIDQYIVPPELGDDAGVVGAMELARDKLTGRTA